MVHRIDRDTSGLVLFARDGEAQAALKRQFETLDARGADVRVRRGNRLRDVGQKALPVHSVNRELHDEGIPRGGVPIHHEPTLGWRPVPPPPGVRAAPRVRNRHQRRRARRPGVFQPPGPSVGGIGQTCSWSPEW